MKMITFPATVLLLGLVLTGCDKPTPCKQPEPPYVFAEGVYDKYGGTVALREQCPPPVVPVVTAEGADNPGPETRPDPKPREPERPQPETPGERPSDDDGDGDGSAPR